MPYTSLSAGQLDCLRLLIGCRDSGQIAAELGVSADYVENQLDGACTRLGVGTRIEAAMVAATLGLISDP
jgi:DNA-binding CsgD family transcriptional regulator